jgi:hypothetical protein
MEERPPIVQRPSVAKARLSTDRLAGMRRESRRRDFRSTLGVIPLLVLLGANVVAVGPAGRELAASHFGGFVHIPLIGLALVTIVVGAQVGLSGLFKEPRSIGQVLGGVGFVFVAAFTLGAALQMLELAVPHLATIEEIRSSNLRWITAAIPAAFAAVTIRHAVHWWREGEASFSVVLGLIALAIVVAGTWLMRLAPQPIHTVL